MKYKLKGSSNLEDNSDAKNKKNILICIESLSQDINGEERILTFFKDITFGILYEQIKIQEDLRNIMNNTIHKKVSAPMQTVIKSCIRLEQSKEL